MQPVRPKSRLALGWLLWALFAAFGVYCAHGFPPPVDLPAHGAQLQTLVQLLRGDQGVARYYQIEFPLGYGLVYWLFLPLAWLTNGAFAVKVALFIAVLLFPLSAIALARAFGRSPWVAVYAAPLAFNVSYWYGLLGGLWAEALAFFALAAIRKAVTSPGWRWMALANVLALATLLAHLVAFAVLSFLAGVLALCTAPRAQTIFRTIACLGLAALASVPKVLSMASKAVESGPWPKTEYGWPSHLNWFFKNYRPEGALAAIAPLVVSAVFIGCWIAWRRREPKAPFILLVSLLALYFATPKTLSGIFLINVRLPVFLGMLALLLVDVRAIPRALAVAMALLSGASLFETGRFHHAFREEVAGLEEMVRLSEHPGQHGYLPLTGREVLQSKIIYAEHLGQWVTATRGGVGHNFFADADHHPVRFRPGVDIPTDLQGLSAERLAWFETVYVFGAGALPQPLEAYEQLHQAGAWRMLRRKGLR